MSELQMWWVLLLLLLDGGLSVVMRRRDDTVIALAGLTAFAYCWFIGYMMISNMTDMSWPLRVAHVPRTVWITFLVWMVPITTLCCHLSMVHAQRSLRTPGN